MPPEPPFLPLPSRSHTAWGRPFSQPRTAQTWAARTAGCAAISLMGYLVVGLGSWYLGDSPWARLFDTAYAAILLLGTGAGALGFLGRRRWAPAWTGGLLAVNLGLFIPPLSSSPLVCSGIVLWHLLLLNGLLFRTPGKRRGPKVGTPGPDSELAAWIDRAGGAALHLLLVSLFITVAVVGYRMGGRAPAQILNAIVDLFSVTLTVPLLRILARERPRLLALPVLTLAGSAAAAGWSPEGALFLLAVYQAYASLLILRSMPLIRELFRHFFEHPTRLLLLSFFVLIIVGTLFLSFPASAPEGRPVGLLDALFTSTSACCVTGLIVLDTPNDFSPFGHLVILVLIQAGGLNIMVLSAFTALLLGRSLGLKGRRLLGETLDLSQAQEAQRITLFIVASTLVLEAAGWIPLAVAFRSLGSEWGEAAWKGLFHTVSAFCNAGFALQSDSVALFRDRALPLLTLAALITVGGLGFSVLAAGWSRFAPGRRPPVGIQVRLVLAVSLVLVLSGTVWFGVAEWNRTLAGLTTGHKILNALFQSVTLRTAGFNSVDLGGLHPGTVLMMMVFMFIGASPGSTGGGIKTTTVAVLLGAIPAMARGESRIVFFGRRVPLEIVYRSSAIAGITILLGTGGLALLLFTQGFCFVRISPDPSKENEAKPTQEDKVALAHAIDALLK